MYVKQQSRLVLRMCMMFTTYSATWVGMQVTAVQTALNVASVSSKATEPLPIALTMGLSVGTLPLVLCLPKHPER
jgi:hypothetical protein